MPLFPRLSRRINAHRREAKPLAQKLRPKGYDPPPLTDEDDKPSVAQQRRDRPLRDFITRAAINAVLNRLKGLKVLTGYKTYITAAAIVAVAALETFVGIDVPGFDMGLSDSIVMAAGLVFARIGAKTEAKKVG